MSLREDDGEEENVLVLGLGLVFRFDKKSQRRRRNRFVDLAKEEEENDFVVLGLVMEIQ